MNNTGDLRYSIQILQPVPVKDQYGADSITYSVLYNLRASKKDAGGTKGITNAEIFTSNNLVFETHYRNITEDMIVLFKDKKYKINNISEVGYRQGIKLTVEKINE